MLYLRGAIWATLTLSVGPEMIAIARAEPRSAVEAEVADTAPATANFKLVPTAAAAGAAVSVAPVTAVAPLAAAIPAPPPKPAITLQAKVDLGRQLLTVSEHGKVVGSWKISSGVSAEFATPRGVFRPEWMAKMWFSKKYDDAPMPNAVFFKGGAAIHATQAVGRLGTPASHGCVRLAPGNAETLYRLVQRHGPAHTQIHVFGNPAYPQMTAQASQASRHSASVNAGPTRAGMGYAGWIAPPRPVQYANVSPFAASAYNRLPISAARYR